MDNRSYSGITRSDVEKIRSSLGKYGITIPDGDNVEVTGPLGVRMKVVYNEAGQRLDLSILEKPAYVSEAQIWKVVEMGADKLNGSS